MSIQSEIERISQAKTDIHSAIESKGVTVPDDTLISEMAPYIQQIREAGTVVTSVSNIGPDESGNAQLKNLRIYCGEQDITYNGGAEQTLTINPSTVGAATAAQGTLAQTAVQPAQIADFITAEDIPDELPNPYSLGIQLNGGSTTAYDGSATRNVNITPAAIGAATSSDLEALEPLVGTTSNTTPLQVFNALSDNRPCFITDSSTYVTYTSWSYNGTTSNGNVHGVSIYINSGRIVSSSLDGAVSSNGGTWNRNNTSGLLYTGSYRSSNTQFLTATSSDGLVLEDISSIIDNEIPSSLPNPNNLIIRQNNGVGTSYNGQTQVTINITASSVGAAPIMHSATNTTYGVGSQNYYGHVRLSDSTSPAYGQTSGVAATPLAVKQVNDNIPIVVHVNMASYDWSSIPGIGSMKWLNVVHADGITEDCEIFSVVPVSNVEGNYKWSQAECGTNQLVIYSDSKENPGPVNSIFAITKNVIQGVNSD